MTASSFYRIKKFAPLVVFFSLLSQGTLAASTTENAAIPYPSVDYGSGAHAAQIQRGEYLAKVGDCIACHTVAGAKPFSGSYPIKTPFGTLYAPNITSDKEYGIGSWTDKQFIKAMREGVSPTGHFYYPAFPYAFFNAVTTKDLLAIRAYLNAIPAVHQPNKANELMWPFSWRFLQLGWRVLFFSFEKPGIYQQDPHQSKEWNRGAYFVQGLGHCSMCHTPSYYMFSKKFPLAAPATQYYLTGAPIEGYFSPDITSNLMKTATVEDLKDVFKKDKMIGGGDVQGPMLDVNHNSLQYLKEKDIEAILIYLKTVQSKSQPKESHGTGLEAGQAIYDQYCTGCHSTGAGGAPKVGDNTAWAPLVKQGLSVTTQHAINGIGGMPPKGTCVSCSDQDIQFAVEYMVSQSKPGMGSSSTQAKPLPPLTLEDGEKIYNTYCAVCHNPNVKHLNTPALGDRPTWKPIIKQGMDVMVRRTVRGYHNMPPRGGCKKCNDAEIKAAVKYMVEKSKTSGDYSLW